MNILLFVYDFPHRKCQDFMFQLFMKGINLRVGLVIGAPYKKLNIPKATVRTKIKSENLIHPSIIAKRFNWPYLTLNHNSSHIECIVNAHRIDLGVVAGARILKPSTFSLFPDGVLNIHPGLIPENRGLDALLWGILNDKPQGVTAHIVDKYIDAGGVLCREEIKIYKDDTVFDISERLHQAQINILWEALHRIEDSCERIEIDPDTPYHSKMSPELEIRALARFNEYKKKWSV